MADQKHVELLRQGEQAWNKWREANPGVIPDLRRAELQGSLLMYCNLSGADLREARLASGQIFVARTLRRLTSVEY